MSLLALLFALACERGIRPEHIYADAFYAKAA